MRLSILPQNRICPGSLVVAATLLAFLFGGCALGLYDPDNTDGSGPANPEIATTLTVVVDGELAASGMAASAAVDPTAGVVRYVISASSGSSNARTVAKTELTAAGGGSSELIVPTATDLTVGILGYNSSGSVAVHGSALVAPISAGVTGTVHLTLSSGDGATFVMPRYTVTLPGETMAGSAASVTVNGRAIFPAGSGTVEVRVNDRTEQVAVGTAGGFESVLEVVTDSDAVSDIPLIITVEAFPGGVVKRHARLAITVPQPVPEPETTSAWITATDLESNEAFTCPAAAVQRYTVTRESIAYKSLADDGGSAPTVWSGAGDDSTMQIPTEDGTGLWINSNGSVHGALSGGYRGYSEFELENISIGTDKLLVAGFLRDLNPRAGGTVQYRVTGTKTQVEWSEVPRYGTGGRHTFLVSWENGSGVVTLDYGYSDDWNYTSSVGAGLALNGTVLQLDPTLIRENQRFTFTPVD